MNTSKTFYKRGFWIVLVLNILLIGLIWFQFHKPENHKTHLIHVLQELKENLKLTTQQAKKMDAIFLLHQREIDSIRLKTKQIHEAAFNTLKKNVASHTINSNYTVIQPSFEEILFKHHFRILSILTHKQQQKYIIDLQKNRPKGPPNMN